MKLQQLPKGILRPTLKVAWYAVAFPWAATIVVTAWLSEVLEDYASWSEEKVKAGSRKVQGTSARPTN